MSYGGKRILKVGAAALAIAATGAAGYWYFRLRPTALGDRDRLLGAAALLPSQALMATYVSTQDEPWSQWQSLDNPALQALVTEPLATLEQEVLGSRNLTYAADVQPWVNGVMLSLLPPMAVRSDGDFNLLLLVGIGDPLKAQAFARQLQEQPDTQLQTSDYQGVEVSALTLDDQTLYSAVLGNFLALSLERQSIEQTIDTFQGGDALGDQPGVTQALQGTLNLDNPVLQVYVPDYGALLNQLLVASPNAAPLPPETLSQLQQFGGVSAALALEDQGVRFQAVVKLDPSLEGVAFEPAPGQVLEHFPASTVALFNGQNLGSLWQTYVQQSEGNPQLALTLDNVRRRFQEFDLDPDRDLFSWMTGEFALGALPSSGGIMGQVGLGAALILDSNDRPTTEATLVKLDRLAERSNLQVQQSTTDAGQPLTQWILPEGFFQNEVLLGYGWLDGDSLFMGLGSSAVEAMTTPQTSGLQDSPAFQAVVTALPERNSGYFYLNVAGSEAQLSQSPLLGPLKQLPGETDLALQSLQSLGITTTQRDRHTSQIDLFVSLEPPATSTP
ncbi:DUF3352 domain-containing protein [Prochlorothrix hollandica]|uniref:DUF3352 domain-containing protein n=1 Tax=Prochlorothrix hollandica PCC 9006 = CALU 1027 TaxID=317619 RepID=A0A0M2Q489_PROHO|nr:DUF3352 domain-containing protein [Prochlorothrix hollandica]KKJ01387.1 hypothetical protein PROH_03315 [Prochlorothrix hollandica PCC 9006 = CALU 1027]